MVWVRLDDQFDQNPKVAQVGPLGIALWTVGLAYCNRNLTDGFIPWTTAQSLLSWEYLGPEEPDGRRRRYQISTTCGMAGNTVTNADVIEMLLDAGLWEELPNGYRVHDFSEFQPTKEQVLAERESSKARTARSRARNAASNAVTNGVSNGPVTVVPVPVPVGTKVPITARAPRQPKGHKPLTDAQKQRIETDFKHIPNLQEEIAFALDHEAYRKSSDDNLYLRHWLRGWRGPTNGNANGHAPQRIKAEGIFE